MMSQLGRGKPALGRQLAREHGERAPRLSLRAREPLGIGTGRQDRKARNGFLGESGQFLGPDAILSCRVVNRSQPRFDACKLARIQVEPLAIGTQHPRSFVGTYSCLVAKRHHVVQRRVMESRLFEPLHHGGQT
jgi:hypothetical protein